MSKTTTKTVSVSLHCYNHLLGIQMEYRRIGENISFGRIIKDAIKEVHPDEEPIES